MESAGNFNRRKSSCTHQPYAARHRQRKSQCRQSNQMSLSLWNRQLRKLKKKITSGRRKKEALPSRSLGAHRRNAHRNSRSASCRSWRNSTRTTQRISSSSSSSTAKMATTRPSTSPNSLNSMATRLIITSSQPLTSSSEAFEGLKYRKRKLGSPKPSDLISQVAVDYVFHPKMMLLLWVLQAVGVCERLYSEFRAQYNKIHSTTAELRRAERLFCGNLKKLAMTGRIKLRDGLKYSDVKKYLSIESDMN